ncbi:hypothetical protein ACOME3_005363 [Neoechinorhynchus agilis]
MLSPEKLDFVVSFVEDQRKRVLLRNRQLQEHPMPLYANVREDPGKWWEKSVPNTRLTRKPIFNGTVFGNEAATKPSSIPNKKESFEETIKTLKTCVHQVLSNFNSPLRRRTLTSEEKSMTPELNLDNDSLLTCSDQPSFLVNSPSIAISSQESSETPPQPILFPSYSKEELRSYRKPVRSSNQHRKVNLVVDELSDNEESDPDSRIYFYHKGSPH